MKEVTINGEKFYTYYDIADEIERLKQQCEDYDKERDCFASAWKKRAENAEEEVKYLRETIKHANAKAKEIEGALCYELSGVSLLISLSRASGLVKDLIVYTGKAILTGNK